MRFEILTIFLGFLVLSCNDRDQSGSNEISNLRENYLQSIDEWQELKLIQTDDRYGEFGGNTFIFLLYRESDSDALFADYKELEGSKEPPPPPNPDSIIKPWYNYKPIVEKKSLKLSTAEKKLVENSILELTVSKLANKDELSHSGISNSVINRDSSLVIIDYPSIEWSNFRKLRQSILEK